MSGSGEPSREPSRGSGRSSPGPSSRPEAEALTSEQAGHAAEAHHGDVSGRLNWLRAGVLGANDGIVSVAGLVVGVAGATTNRTALLTAGIAGLVAGALSMAGGEYVSVSTQRDTERALLDLERWELEHLPDSELNELTELYHRKGISEHLARQVAIELTRHDALGAHAEAELGLDPEALTSPWQAAAASLVAFTVGGLLPLLAIVLPAAPLRVPICALAVVLALILTGDVSARLGRAASRPAILRNVAVGLVGMIVTYLVGRLVGVAL
jgi:VIT1/CCC1 family predicted Fe2+/Mn2+ transporter